MKKSKIIILLSVVFIASVVIWFGCNFAPGSYPYAERYELNSSEEIVQAAIEEFKQENPEYVIPYVTVDGGSKWELKDERTQNPSHWFKFYFYYPKENQIILTWIRSAEKGKTTFAFVSINEGLALGNWKDINHDFKRSENKEQKKKFEERILNKIKEKL
tara:strand:+ start:974 stop:1453 length:480 start_codon:yes stop_codon:yes gene_type:complete